MGDYTEIAKKIEAATRGFKPDVALTLGSGWRFDCGRELFCLSYSELGIPQTGVAGHSGEAAFCEIDGIKVMILKGRVHYYEGFSQREVVAGVRAAALSGAKTVILTNAAGGVNPDFDAGDFMSISDHILLAPNPLIGENDDALGERFPDMSGAYDAALSDSIIAETAKAGITMRRGVYCQFTGPSYETPAEVRMARAIGADAVGMSTAAEAVAARHAGVKVAGISLITNAAAGLKKDALSHAEVVGEGEKKREEFNAVLKIAVKCAKALE